MNHLLAWTGAEVVTLELAEFLAAHGWQVAICPTTYSAELANEIGAMGPHVELITGTPPSLEQVDLVWSMHHAALPALGRMAPQVGSRRPVFVFSHLSPYDPLEAASPITEPFLADFVVANSEETANSLPAILRPRIRVVPNPAPDRFFHSRQPVSELRHLLLVSNHAPPEIEEALPILGSRGMIIKRLGLAADHRRLQPEDLTWAHAVITIGKTVQYAVASQTPVFCYDHFGGPGWLLPTNFLAARRLNFSGRSHPHRRSAAEIAREIEEGYLAARDAAFAFPREDFRYRPWLEPILEEVRLRPVWMAAQVEAHRGYRTAMEAEVRLVEALQRAVRQAESARLHGAQQTSSFHEAMRLLEESRSHSRTLEAALADCQQIAHSLATEVGQLRLTAVEENPDPRPANQPDPAAP